MIPLDPAGNIRAACEAQPASDTKVLIDHANVPMLRIRLIRPHGPNRADLDTRGILTLAAGRHKDVVRPVDEGILLDLDAREGVRGHSRVSQSAGHHAGAATLTFFQVQQEKAFGIWYGVGYGKQLAGQQDACVDRGGDTEGSGT
jgi:hypothetical protein